MLFRSVPHAGRRTGVPGRSRAPSDRAFPARRDKRAPSARCGLTGFTPILAVKNKIIKCDWKNLSEDYFEKYYSIDDVIDKGRHNQSIADKMPNLWWIKANDFISFHKKSPQEWDYAIDNESDFYHGAGDKLGVFVSEKAKSFMESLCLPLKYNEL